MNKTVPAISIIIPMYNVEKYVGECLDSILAQTFTDYEVIAVDDCSTDKTCEIVESYKPKFGGKLKLIESKVNSGGAGTPRNTGLQLSRGKYIFFMDSDDAIVEEALQTFYDTATKFDADIVHCEKWFVAPGDTVTTNKNNLKIESFSNIDPQFIGKFVEQPTVVSENLADRINDFCAGKFWWAPWAHFFKRNLFAENDINFSNLRIADDLIFSFFVMTVADKIVYLPDTLYVWRTLQNSNSRNASSVEKIISKRAFDIFRGVELLDKFTNKFDFFKKNYGYKHLVFNFFTERQVGNYISIYAQIPAWQLDGLIRRELSEVKDKTALTAFLFARMNLINVQLLKVQNLLRQQPKEVQDFQRNNEIIQRQQAQIQQLQHQLRNVHDIFN